jgi:tetratricopeptide (TPR) repeat protein
MHHCRECSAELDYSTEFNLYRCRNFHCNKLYTEDDLTSPIHSLWFESAFHDYPSIIAHEYWRLYSLIQKEQVYGALLQLKDVLEVLIKFPSLTLLSSLYHEGKKDVEPFITLLKEPLSIGHWSTIASHIKKSSPQQGPVHTILNAIHKIYYTYDIPNWRNEKIGHGALSFDSQSCLKQDIEPLLKVMKKHFEEYDSFYKKISFFQEENGVRTELYGKENGRNIVHSASNLFVEIDGKKIALFPYISLVDKGIFFFDSYYPKRNKTVLLNYPEGKRNEKVDEVHEVISSHYKALAHQMKHVSDTSSIADKTYSELEISILSKLQEVDDFQSPRFIVDQINKYLNDDKAKKGLFLLQMERGMGKTTFVRALDELSIHKHTPKDTAVRAYYLNDTFLYKTRYFSQKLSDILRQNKHGDTVISNLLPLTLTKKDRKNDFIRFLNDYHEAYRTHFNRDKLLVILDGIDEIPNHQVDDSIFDYLPDQHLMEEKLNDGIFILLTCRTAEEVSPWMKRKLSELSFTNTPLCYTRNNPEYIELLEQYILKQFGAKRKSPNKQNQEDRLQLLEKTKEMLLIAENRFVYLKILKDIVQNNRNDLEILHSEGVFASFIEKIKQYYGDKYFHSFLSLLVIIATAQEPLTIEEIAFLYGEEKPTFKLLAFLTDMRGFLRVDRSSRGNLFSISNLIWKEKIVNYDPTVCQETFSSYKRKMDTFSVEATKWTNSDYDGLSYLLAHFSDLPTGEKLSPSKDLHIFRLMTEISRYFVVYSKLNYQLTRAKKIMSQMIESLSNKSNQDSLFLCLQAMMSNSELLYHQHLFEEAFQSIHQAQKWIERKHKQKQFPIEHYDRSLIGLLGVKARLLKEMRRYSESLEIFHEIGRIMESHHGNQITRIDRLDNVSNIGIVLMDLKRYEESEKILSFVLGEWKMLYERRYLQQITLTGVAKSLLNRGTLYERMRLYEKVVTDTKGAISYLENNRINDQDHNLEVLMNAYFNLGNGYSGLEERQEAILAYSKSISLIEDAIEKDKFIHHPYYIETLVKRGQQYQLNGEYDLAVKDFSFAKELAAANV